MRTVLPSSGAGSIPDISTFQPPMPSITKGSLIAVGTGASISAVVIPLTAAQFIKIGIVQGTFPHLSNRAYWQLLGKTCLKAFSVQTALKTGQLGSILLLRDVFMRRIYGYGLSVDEDRGTLAGVSHAFRSYSMQQQQVLLTALSTMFISPSQQVLYGHINNTMRRELAPTQPKLTLRAAFAGTTFAIPREIGSTGLIISVGAWLKINYIQPSLPAFLEPVAPFTAGVIVGAMAATVTQWTQNLSFAQVEYCKAQLKEQADAAEKAGTAFKPLIKTRPYTEIARDIIAKKGVTGLLLMNLDKRVWVIAGVGGCLGFAFNDMSATVFKSRRAELLALSKTNSSQLQKFS